jgi:hypothetical protein
MSSQHQGSNSALAATSHAASLNWLKTMANDTNLFLAARAAGLVRILVRDLEDELKRTEQNGEPINGSLWWAVGTSGINQWCDHCLKIIGAQVLYGKHLCRFLSFQKVVTYGLIECFTCPPLAGGNWVISHCSECNNSKKTLCHAESHELMRNDCFKSSGCLATVYPDLQRWCDAVDCGKKISGLYFREWLQTHFR